MPHAPSIDQSTSPPSTTPRNRTSPRGKACTSWQLTGCIGQRCTVPCKTRPTCLAWRHTCKSCHSTHRNVKSGQRPTKIVISARQPRRPHLPAVQGWHSAATLVLYFPAGHCGKPHKVATRGWRKAVKHTQPRLRGGGVGRKKGQRKARKSTTQQTCEQIADPDVLNCPATHATAVAEVEPAGQEYPA